MENEIKTVNARDQYADAHDAHYSAKNLPLAVRLYQEIMALHPRSCEAAYSQTQLQNIACAVVPKRELLDAQLKLADAHFGNAKPATGQ